MGEAQPEQLRLVAVAASASHVGIGNVAFVVLAFQVDVHHQRLVARITPKKPCGLARLVVHLHGLHRVGRQVLERHEGVALEEVAAIEEQARHEPPIDIDAPIVVQRNARQLAHKGMEHAALGQRERVGVVDHSVATLKHLDLGGRNLHLAQQGGVALQAHQAGVDLGDALGHTDHQVLAGAFVAQGGELQDIRALARTVEGVAPPLVGYRALYLNAVASQQAHRHGR